MSRFTRFGAKKNWLLGILQAPSELTDLGESSLGVLAKPGWAMIF